jgi:hypothetical protein
MVKPFTKEEIEKEEDGFPSRGNYCPRCKTNIPVFEGINKEEEEKIRTAANGDTIETIRLIRERTGCGVRWAKIWALHPNGPQEEGYSGNAKCPFCGANLRTPRAKQCPSCFKSWRSQNNT